MKKIALILALLMILTVSLVACGDDTPADSSAPETSDTQPDTPQTPDDTEPGETTEPAETDNGEENWSKDYPV